MSAIFHDYANYYNLIYENKDYRAEIEFVDSLFKAHATQKIKTLLELGSGTGKHAYHLAQKGFHVHGIDQSETMLAVAKDYFAMQPKTLSERVHFSKGDVRSLSLKQSFDAALSLFHVMSYQINQSDIDAAFETVKKHVVPGGIIPPQVNRRNVARDRFQKNSSIACGRGFYSYVQWIGPKSH